MCTEALAANAPVKVLCATNLWLSQHGEPPTGTEVYEVDSVALERLSGLRTPNEVWMLVDRAAVRKALPAASDRSPVLALDRLQDPGNLGTILRTADWFGVRHVVCSPDTVSCFNPKVVQASMGSLLRTSVCYVPLAEWLQDCGREVYGALLDGENIWEGGNAGMRESWSNGAVLVIGNESAGISPEVQAQVTHRVAIPNVGGTAESLNASVACAILLAEMMRP